MLVVDCLFSGWNDTAVINNATDVRRPYLQQAQWISKLSIDGRVRGVTQLNGRVFVVSAQSSVIHVFEDCLTTFARCRPTAALHVSGLKVRYGV